MKASQKSFRWGFIGTGEIATRMAIDMVHVPGAVRHSVLSRDGDRGEGFAYRREFAQSHTDMATFLNDPALDIVYICSPHPVHCDQALAAMDAGKAVVVEKPITMTAADARAIADKSAKTGVFAMEALWTRFLPALQRAKVIIDSGALGAIERVEATLHFHRAYDPDHRLFNPALGGGVLHDLGVYPLSTADYLLGALTLERAVWRPALNGVDKDARLTLRTVSGAKVSISVGFEDTPRGEGANCIDIYGDKGALRINRHFLRAHALTQWDTPQKRLPSPIGWTSRIRSRLGLNTGRVEMFERQSRGLNFQASAVQYALANGLREHPVMPLSDSVAVMDLIEAARDPANRR